MNDFEKLICSDSKFGNCTFLEIGQSMDNGSHYIKLEDDKTGEYYIMGLGTNQCASIISALATVIQRINNTK